MGARNVKRVFVHWGRLADLPFRLLAYMALVSKDDGDPPRFWGGRGPLAAAAGRPVPEPPSAKDLSDFAQQQRAERRRGFKVIDRALSDLRKAGAITQLWAAHTGRNAEYGLNLGPDSTPVSGDQSVKEDPGQRGASRPTGPRLVGQWSPVSGSVVPGDRGPEEEKEEEGKRRNPQAKTGGDGDPQLDKLIDYWADCHDRPPAERTTKKIRAAIAELLAEDFTVEQIEHALYLFVADKLRDPGQLANLVTAASADPLGQRAEPEHLHMVNGVWQHIGNCKCTRPDDDRPW